VFILPKSTRSVVIKSEGVNVSTDGSAISNNPASTSTKEDEAWLAQCSYMHTLHIDRDDGNARLSCRCAVFSEAEEAEERVKHLKQEQTNTTYNVHMRELVVVTQPQLEAFTARNSGVSTASGGDVIESLWAALPLTEWLLVLGKCASAPTLLYVPMRPHLRDVGTEADNSGGSGGRGGGEFTLNRRFHTAADVCKEGSDDVGAVLYKAVDWVHLPRKGIQKEPALAMAVAVRAASRRLRGGLVQRMVTFVER
jgi:hypothetical protein